MIKPEHDYAFSLHRVDEPSSSGFGYNDEALVASIAQEWSSYTTEGCTHAASLAGAKCQLCGNKYTTRS